MPENMKPRERDIRSRRTVDSYIAALPADGRTTAEALRAAILSAEPAADESIKWGQPVYDVNGPFVAMKAFPRWVTLTFWRGATLSDPEGILEGDGDRMRHARFASADSIPRSAVDALVREAVAKNRELGDPTKRR
jgi:hypothetical protein